MDSGRVGCPSILCSSPRFSCALQAETRYLYCAVIALFVSDLVPPEFYLVSGFEAFVRLKALCIRTKFSGAAASPQGGKGPTFFLFLEWGFVFFGLFFQMTVDFKGPTQTATTNA